MPADNPVIALAVLVLVLPVASAEAPTLLVLHGADGFCLHTEADVCASRTCPEATALDQHRERKRCYDPNTKDFCETWTSTWSESEGKAKNTCTQNA